MGNIQEQLQSQNIEQLFHELHERIVRAREGIAKNILEVGESLTLMQETRAFTARYDSFEEYVRDALGMSKASAYVYISIYKTYVQSGLIHELERTLDRTRVRELTGTTVDSPAVAALSALGPKKLEALKEVMQSPLPTEQKTSWIYRAMQEPNVKALRQAVIREHIIPKGGEVIKSCFNCIFSSVARSGDRLGGFLVGSKGILICRKQMVLVGTLTSTDAQRIAEGTEDKPGCPDYQVCPEWKE